MLKDLMAIVDTADKDDQFIIDAAALARHHDAHLTVAILSPIPTADYAMAFGAPFIILDEFVKLSEEKKARTARLEGSFPGEIRTVSDELGRLVELVAVQGRYYDLVLFGPEEAYGSPKLRRLAIEAVALASGRPALVLPSGREPRQFDHIAIGWNATRESARALKDALSLLTPGGMIDIIAVDAQPSTTGHGSQPGADIAHHLSRHGYKLNVFDVSSDGQPVSATLAGLAERRSADLLAIGAYGHSRWRETLLGGVTRDLLDGTAIPLLLSH